MNEAISQMLCTSSDGETVLEDEEALAHVRAIESQDVLIERLLANGVAQRLATAIWPKLEILQAGPATASELANQWAEEGAGDLLYGGLPPFSAVWRRASARPTRRCSRTWSRTTAVSPTATSSSPRATTRS